MYADIEPETKENISTFQKWFHKKSVGLTEEEKKVARELRAKFDRKLASVFFFLPKFLFLQKFFSNTLLFLLGF
ncbi:hypothetical protein EPT55_10320, partial [Fusobacterium necrophorum]|uniref:hypothetical protein n=1 Tax=Fusobacterium necrophorum TaxID=859 RepID=UPI0010268F03